MTDSSDEAPHRLQLTRAKNDGVYVWSNDRCLYFSKDMWDEFMNMSSDFNRNALSRVQNFPDLPTRTPIHANVPSPRATLDDLA